MKRKKATRLSGQSGEYVMWLLERRTDIGPLLRLIRIVHGEVEDYVARRAIRRLAKNGKVETLKKGRTFYYQPVDLPTRDEAVALKIAQQHRNWNGRWGLVTYDLPGKAQGARKKLIRLMRTAGLGMLNRSSWISPYDTVSLVMGEAETFGASEYLKWARDAELVLGEDPAGFAQRTWHLGALSKRYESVITECERIRKLDLRRERDRRVALRTAFHVFKAWTAIQTDDPMLPRQLLPEGWPAEAAREAVSVLQRDMKGIAAKAADFSMPV